LRRTLFKFIIAHEISDPLRKPEWLRVYCFW